MDYTTDLTNLSRDDLIDELKKQLERNRELKIATENDTQRIYELTRQLEAANATQAYLMQELEQQGPSTATDAETKAQNKFKSEYDELRKKYNEVNLNYENLQEEFEKQQTECAELKEQLSAINKPSEDKSGLHNIIDDYQKRIAMLENENMELMQKLEEVQCNEVQQILAMGAQEKKIEVLEDQVVCLQENLNSKRLEIDEKVQILESVQDQLIEANAKIAMLTTAPQNNERKGNSLFAEVDDQRQAMRQLLAAQKKNYMQMKVAYNECEHEIRRLKRENIAMHTELQMCSKIFYSADKTYQAKLKERIQHLLNQNEHLEKQLNLTQDRLKTVASDGAVSWLESMLNFCRQETDDLKKQLHGLRIQRASLEEQLRNSQQEMARWRFETLRAKCILLDRENILNENNIVFKSCEDTDFNINDINIELLTKKQLPNTVTPIIGSENSKEECVIVPSTPIKQQQTDIIDIRTPCEPLKNCASPTVKEEPKDDIISSESNDSLKGEGSIKEERRVIPQTPKVQKPENSVDEIKPIKLEKLNTSDLENQNEKVDIQLASDTSKKCLVTEEDKENLTDNRPKITIASPEFLMNIDKATRPPSILTKTHSLLESNCNAKHVKFTEDAPSIYTFTPSKSNDSSITNENGCNNSNIVRKKLSKSNIVVRRVVIKPKTENQQT